MDFRVWGDDPTSVLWRGRFGSVAILPQNGKRHRIWVTILESGGRPLLAFSLRGTPPSLPTSVVGILHTHLDNANFIRHDVNERKKDIKRRL